MSAIVWKDTYSVNVQEIDEQHRKLIALINELDAAMASGKGKDVLAKTLGAVIQYTRTHFANEERLMSTHGYPDFAPHKAEHDKLTKEVVQLQHKFQQSQIGLSIPTLSFLNQWLTTHILNTDKKYSAHLNGKGVR